MHLSLLCPARPAIAPQAWQPGLDLEPAPHPPTSVIQRSSHRYLLPPNRRKILDFAANPTKNFFSLLVFAFLHPSFYFLFFKTISIPFPETTQSETSSLIRYDVRSIELQTILRAITIKRSGQTKQKASLAYKQTTAPPSRLE